MLSTTAAHRATAPKLPMPRGPLSVAVIDRLRGDPTPPPAHIGPAALEQANPYGEDLQLALYCCYELHYRDFAGVADDLEWDPGLLELRRQLEGAFLTALRAEVAGGTDVAAEVDALLVEVVDAESVSHHLRRAGQLWQLAEVNFMSLCGLHRRLRGALVGQFATVELTSSPGANRLVRAMRRLGCRPGAIEFYAEHIEADAVHEQLIRHGVIAPLLAAEPELAADVVFGIQASTLLADRLSRLLLGAWTQNRSTLRQPLRDAPAHTPAQET